MLEAAVAAEPGSQLTRLNLASLLLQSARASAAQQVLDDAPPPHPHDMEARGTLHETLRLAAISRALVAKNSDLEKDGEEARLVKRLTERSIMLAPWDKAGYVALDYVNSVLPAPAPVLVATDAES